MRFVTFLGLIIIAKTINPFTISEDSIGFSIILLIALLVDVYELIFKPKNNEYDKQNNKS